MKNLWVLNQTPSRTLKVPGCPEEKKYKGSEYKDYSTSRTSNDVHKVQTKPNKGSEYKDYSTSRTSNGVHKVQMKSTKVHPRNDAKYESQKKKLNPVYNLGFTQK